ncbi:MAG TPA: NmrA family NAD(P)-binding protein [Kofleriaceae bacterium]|nr:NmrA family NAD(P)-binding protein [Kofleriaceae bacterium]
MYVIAGVTGKTGSTAADALLAAKQPVRVIVRDAHKGEPWKAKGAEVAIASLDDRAALARALTGATGAYLLLPPSGWTDTNIAADRAKYAEAIVGAVRDAKPGHVVLLSSVGADLPSGTGPIQYVHPIEEGLRASGVPTTLLRCAFFMENWGASIPGALESGTLYYGIRGDLRFPQVATEDIGKTAARLLVEGAPRGTRVVQLAGPAELTLAETAATLGKVAGKPIQAVSVPTSATIDSLVGMGASRELAALYGEMMDAFNDGRARWQSDDLVRGTTTLEQKLRQLTAR